MNLIVITNASREETLPFVLETVAPGFGAIACEVALLGGFVRAFCLQRLHSILGGTRAVFVSRIRIDHSGHVV